MQKFQQRRCSVTHRRCYFRAPVYQALLLIVGIALPSTVASADPITTTLEGCVSVTDGRLESAMWFAQGTFQAVAFDDQDAGCEPTVTEPVLDAYVFDENRTENTLTAWLNLQNLPSCGRRQYDLHYYLSEGVLDPFGLKSLVIDTGVPCINLDSSNASTTALAEGHTREIAAPGPLALIACGLAGAVIRHRRQQQNALSGD